MLEVCKTCANPLEAGQKSYCKPACNPKRLKRCVYCQEDFVDTSRSNGSKFCGPKCQRKAKLIRQARKRGEEPPQFLDELELSCQNCSEKFTPTSANQKYCSDDCRLGQYEEERWEGVPEELSREAKCLECGKTFTGCIPHGGRSGNHFEDTHSMTTEEYLSKFPEASIYSDAAKWKMTQAPREFPDDFSDTLRQAQKKRYEQEDVWNKGLTKDDHASIQRQAEVMRLKAQHPEYKNGFQGRNHSKKAKAHFSKVSSSLKNDLVYQRNWLESLERLSKTGSFLSEPHAVLIQALRDIGLWKALDCEAENWVTLQGKPHAIDISIKGPKPLAIEVDGCWYHGCPKHVDFTALAPHQLEEKERQRVRDREIDHGYVSEGWPFLRIWEHDLRNNLTSCLSMICDMVGYEWSGEASYSEVQLDLDLKATLANSSRYASTDLGDKTDQEILDYYQKVGFPYPRYTPKQIRQDFEMLCKRTVEDLWEDETTFFNKQQGLGMKGTKYFQRNFFDARRQGRRSMKETFEDPSLLLKVIQSRRKHAKRITDSTMRTGLRLQASAPSSFPALVAKLIYSSFVPEGGKVLDPCAGFGGRLVGSQALPSPVQYDGFDPWTENAKNLEEMRQYYGFDSCSITNLPFEDAALDDSYNLVFTSPPHYDKEVYCQEDTQSIARYPEFSDWVSHFLRPLVQKSVGALEEGGHLVLHLSEMEEGLVDTTRQLMVESGLTMREPLYLKVFNPLAKNFHLEPFLVGLK